VTVRSLESCNLSNFDQATETFYLLGDEPLGREQDERGRLDLDCDSAVTKSQPGGNIGRVLFDEIELPGTTPLTRGSSFINSPKLSNSDHIAAGLLAHTHERG